MVVAESLLRRICGCTDAGRGEDGARKLSVGRSAAAAAAAAYTTPSKRGIRSGYGRLDEGIVRTSGVPRAGLPCRRRRCSVHVQGVTPS